MNINTFTFRRRYLAIAMSATLAVPVAATPNDELAVDAIERLVVRGDYREQDLNDTPASVSILTRADLQSRNAEHIETMLNRLPNVNFSGGASRARFLQVRGIGERSQFVDPISPAVGILIDGINYSGLGQAGQLFDIGQVELFRGPQSGRFGADGLAGMLVFNSTLQGEAFDGRWQVQAANYGEIAAGIALGSGLGALGRARFSVYQHNSDGFISNAFLGRDDTNDRNEISARFNLVSDLNDDWQLHTTLHVFDFDNGYDAFSLDNNRTSLADEPGQDDLQSDAFKWQLTRQLSSSEMQFHFAQLNADTTYSYDEDWSYVGIAPGWEYSSTDAYRREREDQTLEWRWLSTQPVQWLGVSTDWLLGLYNYQRNVSLTRDFFNFDANAPARFQSDYQEHRQAIYGQLETALTSATKLTTGVRFERYDNDYVDSNFIDANPNDTMWGGRLSLQHQLSAEQQLYLTLARGYKTGGVNGEALGKAQDEGLNLVSDFLLAQSTFEPELLTSLELGHKGLSLDEKLALQVSVFYNWRREVQLKSWVNREQSFVGFIDNAASGDSYGLEAQLDYEFQPNWNGYLNLGLLESEIQGFVTEDGMDMSGRDQAQAPNYMASVGTLYQWDSGLSLSIQLDHKDGFYFSDSHNSRAPSTTQLHAQLAYATGPWQLSLFARNLTDDDAQIRGFFFGNDPRIEYEPRTYVQYGEPRRVGVRVQYQF